MKYCILLFCLMSICTLSICQKQKTIPIRDTIIIEVPSDFFALNEQAYGGYYDFEMRNRYEYQLQYLLISNHDDYNTISEVSLRPVLISNQDQKTDTLVLGSKTGEYKTMKLKDVLADPHGELFDRFHPPFEYCLYLFFTKEKRINEIKSSDKLMLYRCKAIIYQSVE